jgi:Domain of unknown function (DUF4260)
VFSPGVLLRIEGLAIFVASLVLYLDADFSVLAFVLLLLVPDVSIAGYAVNKQVGAAAYNLAHLELWPALLLVMGVLGDEATLVQVALIWFAHIGIDRAVGLGYKYADADFQDTHLNRV